MWFVGLGVTAVFASMVAVMIGFVYLAATHPFIAGLVLVLVLSLAFGYLFKN
jgi:type IV secretory pathway VirB3-like protein